MSWNHEQSTASSVIITKCPSPNSSRATVVVLEPFFVRSFRFPSIWISSYRTGSVVEKRLKEAGIVQRRQLLRRNGSQGDDHFVDAVARLVALRRRRAHLVDDAGVAGQHGAGQRRQHAGGGQGHAGVAPPHQPQAGHHQGRVGGQQSSRLGVPGRRSKLLRNKTKFGMRLDSTIRFTYRF